ncbi:MAG: 4-hydroxy-3-methylbut-2-enyl diphosphate reductase [Chitinophagaceae bacterium]|nr:4-hydroxy-3-methylbut-2-enyl diphosphate reductase [Chitinophagaceae bacterium]
MKKFDVPIIYRSPLISAIKKKRKEWDKTENNASQQGRDFAPTMLDFGPVQIYLARYFGFCYGVENAIEIAFKTVAENKGKKIYLLSEMIHNPQVNADLQAHGIQFLQDTYGKQLIPFSAIQQDDIVLIPAFGTTLLIEEKLKQKGIQTEKYNTTCPFVEKVWNRSEAIAKKNYTIVIHGKPRHEETRATFSHAANNAPSVVVKNMDEAKALAQYITGQKDETAFLEEFKNQHSIGFDIHKDLKRIGVVNQTTMLASHTQAIADYLKQVMLNTFPNDSSEEHFADTRDTLCYATNDNQTAVSNMLNTDAHLAIVVGGYNSSNTSHLVELCEANLPTYFIDHENKILNSKTILHHNFHTKESSMTHHFLPEENPVKILLTSGASCPDALVEGVINKLTGFFKTNCTVEDLTHRFR